MPSREEIVEWLREDALTERSLAIGAKTGAIPAHFYDECIANAVKFEQRAAQAKAMRCETCELYDPGTDYATDCCLHPTISISNQGKNFGCFSHEQKE